MERSQGPLWKTVQLPMGVPPAGMSLLTLPRRFTTPWRTTDPASPFLRLIPMNLHPQPQPATEDRSLLSISGPSPTQGALLLTAA